MLCTERATHISRADWILCSLFSFKERICFFKEEQLKPPSQQQNKQTKPTTKTT